MNINLFRNAYNVFRSIRDTGDEAEAIVAIYFALERIEQDKQIAFTAGYDEASRQAAEDAFMPGIIEDLSGPDIGGEAAPDYSDVQDIPLFGAVAVFLKDELGWEDDESREAAADFMRDYWLSKPHDLHFSDDVMQDPGHTHAVQEPVGQGAIGVAAAPDFVVTSGGTVFSLNDLIGGDGQLVRTVSDFDNANVRR